MSRTQRYVGLVRGINVGGNKRLSMATLRNMVIALGYTEVRTVLQSGNAVFDGPSRPSAEIEATLEAAAPASLGLKALFLVRTSDEWLAAIEANPFPDDARDDPSHLLLTALKAEPDPQELRAVQGAINGPERVEAKGATLYVTYPDGIGASTLAKTPGWNKLVAQGTSRNWNTVLKIAALLGT